MNINLDSLTFVNFKGIKNLTVKFGRETNISGDNATGKTTINDGFRWLLFGKDSEDRTDFNVKTLTPDGKPIHNLDHEVIGVLDVDGIQTTLKRTLKEKWVKPRGQAEVVMQGHETTYFYNDVPMTQREYISKIDAICPEVHFKLLTDPSYFPSLAWTKQRELLFGLAGPITDNDIAQGNPLFIELMQSIRNNNINLIQYKTQLAAKRLKIKEELEKIPTRIDELFRSLPVVIDWTAIQKEIDSREAAIILIDEFITGKTTVQDETRKANQVTRKIRDEKITRRDQIAFDIKTAAIKVVNDAKDSLANIKYTLAQVNNSRNNLLAENIICENTIVDHKLRMDDLREAWRKINAETLTFKEYDFCCPTCAREYDAEKYEAIQAAMIVKFNEDKKTRREANEKDGRTLAIKRDANQTAINTNLVKIEEYNERILALKAQQVTAEEAIPAGQPNITKLLEANTEYQTLCAEIDAILVPDGPVVDITEQQTKKLTCRNEIDSFKKELADKITIEKANTRIDELKASQVKLAQDQADIEKQEFEVTNFEKAKIETIEGRVNGLFSIVKFKMFDLQLNGGENPTCVCTVDGVPYPDLNNAMKINAGMDIISTLSKANNTYAPIFIDNRESVNKLADSQSQIINLIVTHDKELKVA